MSKMDKGELCQVNEHNRYGISAAEHRKVRQSDADRDRTTKIRQLNDQFRTEGRGGMIQMTSSLAALGSDRIGRIFKAVQAFSAFTPDNDPRGEHDCAVFELEGLRLLWKIDCYDPSLTQHSPDPADPAVTQRVLTVMLAEDY